MVWQRFPVRRSVAFFCKDPICSANEHWVSPYYQHEYIRGDGKPVAAKNVKGHCTRNSASFDIWNPKLKEGKPRGWRPASEEPSEWTTEERERVLEVLDETPPILKDPEIFGIYRLKESVSKGNPASNNYADFVLYDDAFKSHFNLTRVLGHELSHRLYEQLPEDQKEGFRKAGGWQPDSTGGFQSDRPKNQYLRPNGALSPVEDFADDIPEFFQQPSKLKRTAPKIYDWVENHFGKKLNLGGRK